MLKFGTINQIKADKGLARVHFPDIDIVSAWLPILVPRTHSDAVVDPMETGEHVACLMDKNNEHGVILGAIYSSEETPPTGAGPDVWMRKFKDGTTFKYDRSTHEYELTNGTLTFKMNRSGGFKISKGTESLDALINDTLDQIQALTVGTSGGPSTVPINAAAFAAIKTRVTAFFGA